MKSVTIMSSGKSVRIAVFPASGAANPAVLLLHGAGGMNAGNHFTSQLAGALVAGGYSTFAVEYFDRTATRYASDEMIPTLFESWLEVISDAMTVIARYPGVDAERLGSLGYSLGGYLAVAHAARDARVRSVVEFAGGLDASFARTVQRLPPVLVIHGEQDRRVPFARAIELENFARRLGAPVETEYLPREGHLLSPPGIVQALQHAVRFFGRYLREKNAASTVVEGQDGRN